MLHADDFPILCRRHLHAPDIPFFRQTRTPDAIGWIFIGFLVIFFGILPGITVVNGLLRARRGCTIVIVSPQGVRVSERGAWRIRTTASLDAADIVDVDFSTRESAVAMAKGSAEQKILESGRSPAATLGPRMERMLAAILKTATHRSSSTASEFPSCESGILLTYRACI